VGRIVSGVRVSGSFQIISHLVGRLGSVARFSVRHAFAVPSAVLCQKGQFLSCYVLGDPTMRRCVFSTDPTGHYRTANTSSVTLTRNEFNHNTQTLATIFAHSPIWTYIQSINWKARPPSGPLVILKKPKRLQKRKHNSHWSRKTTNRCVSRRRQCRYNQRVLTPVSFCLVQRLDNHNY